MAQACIVVILGIFWARAGRSRGLPGASTFCAELLAKLRVTNEISSFIIISCILEDLRLGSLRLSSAGVGSGSGTAKCAARAR